MHSQSLTMVFIPVCFCAALVSSLQSYIIQHTHNVKRTITTAHHVLITNFFSSQGRAISRECVYLDDNV